MSLPLLQSVETKRRAPQLRIDTHEVEEIEEPLHRALAADTMLSAAERLVEHLKEVRAAAMRSYAREVGGFKAAEDLGMNRTSMYRAIRTGVSSAIVEHDEPSGSAKRRQSMADYGSRVKRERRSKRGGIPRFCQHSTIERRYRSGALATAKRSFLPRLSVRLSRLRFQRAGTQTRHCERKRARNLQCTERRGFGARGYIRHHPR